jgi:citrate synthase
METIYEKPVEQKMEDIVVEAWKKTVLAHVERILKEGGDDMERRIQAIFEERRKSLQSFGYGHRIYPEPELPYSEMEEESDKEDDEIDEFWEEESRLASDEE